VKYIIRSTVPTTEVQSPMEQYDEHAERSHQPARCKDPSIIDFEAFLRGVPTSNIRTPWTATSLHVIMEGRGWMLFGHIRQVA
jgi:hypothetical protein